MTRAIGCLLLLLLLGACQERIFADVTRYYTLPPPPYSQTFAILPEDFQVGDLQLQAVGAHVTAALQAYGFRLAEPGGPPPDYMVYMHYGPAGARTQIVDFGTPSFGGPYGRRPYYYPDYRSYTLYAYFLDVGMLDGPAWRRGEKQNAFQGRAIAETGVREFNLVMPYLVQALFKDFPGANGQTVRVTVPVN